MLKDAKERQKALSSKHSFIVQAPAGSGKTSLLIQRYLTLLGEAVDNPEEILAITFTKKAAAEMRKRITDALNHAAENPTLLAEDEPHQQKTHQLALNVLARAKACCWNLLENPSRLRIKTIDAFCQYLTQRMPTLSRFAGKMEINIEPNLTLYEKAALNLLSQLEQETPWSKDIAQLLLHLDNNYQYALSLLKNMLSHRDQWLPLLTQKQDESLLRQYLEKTLESLAKQTLSALESNMPSSLREEIFPLLLFASEHAPANNPNLNVWKAQACFPEFSVANLSLWQGMAALLLTKQDSWRKSVDKRCGFPAKDQAESSVEKTQWALAKKAMQELLSSLFGKETLRHALIRLTKLPPPFYTDNQWEILAALIRLLPVLAAELTLCFQQQQEVDFIEVAGAALTALGDEETPTDLALSLDYSIKHILMDEFQDTSITQFQLLKRLTLGWEPEDDRTLFIVGDPMQSIYRFRQADVSLFLQVKSQGINQISLTPLTLSTNFRSSPSLIHWFNESFRYIFAPENDPEIGAISYAEASSPKKLMIKKTDVQVYPFPYQEEDESIHVLDCIKAIQIKEPKARIAILVQARTHVESLLPALRKASIDYQATEIESLFQTSTIQDLLALTRALLNLTDRTAWLSVLRAPWCGFTLKDLLQLSHLSKDELIWEALQAKYYTDKLSSDARQRLWRLVPIFEKAWHCRQRLPISRWVEEVWLQLGGPACVRNIDALEDAKVFFELLDQCDYGYDISDFTLFLNKLQKCYSSAYSAKEQAVQIMTIHKAKGLEFDHIILPGLYRSKNNRDSHLLRWYISNQARFALAPIRANQDEEQDPIYAYLKYLDTQFNEQEEKRLLYVAVTRAKKKLHLLAGYKEKEQGSPLPPTKGSLLGLLWPHIQLPPATSAIKTTALESMSTEIMRLTSSWQPPGDMIPAMTKISPQPHPEPEDSYWQSFGTAMHRMLEYVAHHKVGLDKKALDVLLLTSGIKNHLLKSASEQFEEIFLKISHCPIAQWIFSSSHQYTWTEYPITFRAENELKTVVLDRAFIDAEGTRWIVDYKTTQEQPENLSTFLAKQAHLYQDQLKSYYLAMESLERRPTRMGLYFPQLCVWQEIKC